MNLKCLSLKLAGGLFAVGIALTAMSGNVERVGANPPQCGPKSCPVLDLGPDLTVTNLQSFKGQNGQLVVQFYERNDGIFASGTFRRQVLVNGAVVSDLLQPSMSGGQASHYTFILPLPTVGKAVVQVVTDAADDVNETNEFNNSAVTSAVW